MFNANQYNTTRYLKDKKKDMSFALCTYNGYDLFDEQNTFINRIQYLSQSEIPYNIYDFGDRKFVNENKYVNDEDVKNIQIDWHLKANNRTELISLMEEFKGKIIRQDAKIKIQEGTITKQAKAYCDNVSFEEKAHSITQINYNLNFKIFGGLEKSTANIYNYNITSNTTKTVSNIGENRANWLAVFTVNSSSSTYIKLTVNWDTITIEDSPSSSDVYRIDAESLSVDKNWNQIDYLGWFNKLDVGDNTIEIQGDWSFDYDLDFKYNVTYR